MKYSILYTNFFSYRFVVYCRWDCYHYYLPVHLQILIWFGKQTSLLRPWRRHHRVVIFPPTPLCQHPAWWRSFYKHESEEPGTLTVILSRVQWCSDGSALQANGTTWTGDLKCSRREVKTEFCLRKRWLQTGSSETLIGWKYGSNHLCPSHRDRTEGVWLWTLLVRQARVQYPPGLAPPGRFSLLSKWMDEGTVWMWLRMYVLKKTKK